MAHDNRVGNGTGEDSRPIPDTFGVPLSENTVLGFSADALAALEGSKRYAEGEGDIPYASPHSIGVHSTDEIPKTSEVLPNLKYGRFIYDPNTSAFDTLVFSDLINQDYVRVHMGNVSLGLNGKENILTFIKKCQENGFGTELLPAKNCILITGSQDFLKSVGFEDLGQFVMIGSARNINHENTNESHIDFSIPSDQFTGTEAAKHEWKHRTELMRFLMENY